MGQPLWVPHCIGGGEIKNVVMQGYSNKAREGYLGDAVSANGANLGRAPQ